MIHRIKLVKGHESTILKEAPKKKIKASVTLNAEVLKAMRAIMGNKPTDSPSEVLQSFLNKTFN